MKALCLRQPWCAAVLRLGKSVENRRWSTTFRGEFLIHAAKGMTKREYLDAVDFCEDVLGIARCFDIERALNRDALRFGGFVGFARLVGVVPPRPPMMLLGVETHYPPALKEGGWRWHMPEQYAFVLEDVRPIPFVPYKGALGFFDVPDEVVARMALPLRPRGEAAHG